MTRKFPPLRKLSPEEERRVKERDCCNLYAFTRCNKCGNLYVYHVFGCRCSGWLDQDVTWGYKQVSPLAYDPQFLVVGVDFEPIPQSGVSI